MAGTTLGNAYVQIIPSAKGIKGSIESELSGEAQSAGTSVGSKIATFAKGAIVAAGIGKAFSIAIKEGAALQQSLGGIETLFKDSADTMKGYASEAFKSAGLSANEYMETATGFAASLVSSLGNDTAQAAEIANMAIIDMSDNANKMGTDMASIQNAYQGFAKQNYTMLDNLKLGYGGTKEEMQRLLSDAEKLTGVKYDISNLSDVYSAIHVIQGELGITGTTADEAATTVSGSFNTMKAAAHDFLGALTGEGVTSMEEASENLSNSVATFLTNLIPMVGKILIKLPEAIGGALAGIGTKFIEMTEDPNFPKAGAEMIKKLVVGIIKAIPNVILGIASMAGAIIASVALIGGELLQQGWDIISQFAKGIWDGANDKIKGVIDKVKGFFDFDIRWPNIPLPHFSVSPSGWGIHDLLENGTIPSLGIEWYAKGGIFNSPSIIGVGEAGKEAAVPLDPFWRRLESFESGIINGVSAAMGGNNQGDIHLSVYMYPNGPKMDEQIVKSYNRGKKVYGVV